MRESLVETNGLKPSRSYKRKGNTSQVGTVNKARHDLLPKCEAYTCEIIQPHLWRLQGKWKALDKAKRR